MQLKLKCFLSGVTFSYFRLGVKFQKFLLSNLIGGTDLQNFITSTALVMKG